MHRNRLDSFPVASVASPRSEQAGRSAIPTDHRASDFPAAADAGSGLDIERLERAVQALAERYAGLRDENAKLARDVAERDQRIAELEGEARRQNQRRRDAAQRIDDLVGQLDQLEGRLVARTE